MSEKQMFDITVSTLPLEEWLTARIQELKNDVIDLKLGIESVGKCIQEEGVKIQEVKTDLEDIRLKFRIFKNDFENNGGVTSTLTFSS